MMTVADTVRTRAGSKEAVAVVKRASGAEAVSRSVQDIEGTVWPALAADTTYLVRTVHRLRQVPIGELGTEDLRIMLSQHVGTATVLPRALDRLQADPLVAGDYYPGDLLLAVLRCAPDAWTGEAELLDKARGIAHRAEAMIYNLDGAQVPELRRLITEFLSGRPEFDPGRTH
ncbi:contact-dependent growth inhibition system immunity protein [Nocardia sp. NPDC056000]|uniref:contact-dependent growth inhibition system immunity protein n=1 Tax=Nocardia sp. NPDC056000 TaxID=3345674 RepID=UPI0035DBB90E